jgi:hypothetical protein
MAKKDKEKWNARMWIIFSAITGAFASKAFESLENYSPFSIEFWFACFIYGFIFIFFITIFARVYGNPP